MNTIEREMPALELALLRRSLPRISENCERCCSCERCMLIGERVYEYASGVIRCELCRVRVASDPARFHMVHGPEFGHSLRVIDRRAA